MRYQVLALLVGVALTAGCRAAPEVGPVVRDSMQRVEGKHWSRVAAAVSGVLRDAAEGFGIAGAKVRFKRTQGGGDYFHEVRTDQDGAFSVRLRFGTYWVDLSKSGYASIPDQQVYTGLAEVSPPLNLPLTRPVGEGQVRIALSWTDEKEGAVKDVDSYLRIPGITHASPLSYKVKGDVHHGSFLDRDDTDWGGPETVTIRAMRPGKYIYYVNNYSSREDCEALGRSNVRVTVTRGAVTLKTYTLEPSDVRDGVGLSYQLFYLEAGKLHDLTPDGKPFRRYNDKLFTHGSSGSSCRNQPVELRWDLLEKER